MRITFVLPPVNLSGGIRVAAIYAKALAQRGHTVRLIAPARGAPAVPDKMRSLLTGHGWPRTQARAPSHFDGTDLDLRILDCRRPVTDDDAPDGDVVIATWWETAEWVGALSPAKGAKVYFVQGYEVFPHLPARSRDTYSLPMHKIVVARWLQDVMAKEYGDDTVDLVPNSVDHAQFFAQPRGKQARPTIGFLYSRVPFKGVDVTLAALERVRRRIPDLRVICFGSQPLTPQQPLPGGVEFTLTPAQDRIRDLYAACDVWVTASRSEGFNLPAMEAMACRAPVVATRTGWPEEAVVTGRNGVLVDIDDVAGLAQGIEWVLTRSDAAWRELSENACATVASSSWQRSAEKFEAALEHACRRAARGAIASSALVDME